MAEDLVTEKREMVKPYTVGIRGHVFEKGYWYVVLAVLKLKIFLIQPLMCWDPWYVPPQPAVKFLIKKQNSVSATDKDKEDHVTDSILYSISVPDMKCVE